MYSNIFKKLITGALKQRAVSKIVLTGTLILIKNQPLKGQTDYQIGSVPYTYEINNDMKIAYIIDCF